MEDWSKHPEARAWLRRVLDEMVPKLEASAFSLSLVPGAGGGKTEGDAKYWVELGASIMLDKPIVLVCERDQELPPRLVRVADGVIRIDHPFDDPRGAKQFHDQLDKIMKRLGLDDG